MTLPAARYVHSEIEMRLQQVIQEALRLSSHRRSDTVTGEDIISAYYLLTGGTSLGAGLNLLRHKRSSESGLGVADSLRLHAPVYPTVSSSLGGLYGWYFACATSIGLRFAHDEDDAVKASFRLKQLHSLTMGFLLS